jgi:hypothetical protein
VRFTGTTLKGITVEKNIAALMREGIKAVSVVFQDGGKGYTYVTELDLQVADRCIVFANNELKVVRVTCVHKQLPISPGDTIKYQWVVDKVNMDGYEKNCAINNEIERVVMEKYQQHLRRSFADEILAGLPTKDKRDLQRLLKKD